MAIITLTSDLGDEDFYVAAVKAVILSHCPTAAIVDVTHKLQMANVIQASFITRNLFLDFPDGTIHIIGISPSAKKPDSHLLAVFNKQYFISGNNGLFSLIFPKESTNYFELNVENNKLFNTFPVKYIYAKAACHIANSGSLNEICHPATDVVEKSMLQPMSNNDTIKGNILYVDHYGNLITNISRDVFQEIGKNRKYQILFRGEIVEAISENYQSVMEADPVALFNSSGYLEIAINNGNASKILGLKEGGVIGIEFKNEA